MKTIFTAIVMSIVISLSAQDISKLNWIDLTYPFSEKTLYWPNNPRGFTFDTLFEGHTDRGFYYASYSFFAPEHGGTHLDAPVHFAEGMKTVDELSLGQLMGEAVVIDVSAHALADRDYQVTIDDLLAWENLVVSTTLAESAGIERADFKLNVRKLKALGLTISLDVGYRLSPRGVALLATL